MTRASAAMRSRDASGPAVGATAPVIVVGLDGSPTSWDAFSWAAGQAARANGRLIAVYVASAVALSPQSVRHSTTPLSSRPGRRWPGS